MAGTTAHKILVFMREQTGYGITAWAPGQVAKRLKISSELIKKTMARLANRGHLERAGDGLYRLFIEAGTLTQYENPPITFHGLSYRGRLSVPEGVEGTPPGTPPTPPTMPGAWARAIYRPTNGSYELRGQLSGRPVLCQYYPSSGTVLVHIRGHSKPFAAPQLLEIKPYLMGLLGIKTDTEWADYHFDLMYWAANCDYEQLRLEQGGKYSLEQFNSHVIEIYQKGELLRVGVHHRPKTPVNERDIAALFVTLTGRIDEIRQLRDSPDIPRASGPDQDHKKDDTPGGYG